MWFDLGFNSSQVELKEAQSLEKRFWSVSQVSQMETPAGLTRELLAPTHKIYLSGGRERSWPSHVIGGPLLPLLGCFSQSFVEHLEGVSVFLDTRSKASLRNCTSDLRLALYCESRL